MSKATLINMSKSQNYNVEGVKQVAEQVHDGTVLGVPKLPSGLMIQQKGSQDPEELLYSELQFSTQIKISKWKRFMEQGPGESGLKLPGVPSQWSCMKMCLILPAKMCDNTCEVLPTREAHLIIGVQRFFEGSVMQSCSTHMTELSYSDSRLSPCPSSKNKYHKSLCQDKFIQSNLYSMAQDLRLTKTPSRKTQNLSARIQLRASLEDKPFFEINRV